jgi:hypothetical protein
MGTSVCARRALRPASRTQDVQIIASRTWRSSDPPSPYFFEMVTAALAVLLESAAAVALTVTVAGFGTEFGAR